MNLSKSGFGLLFVLLTTLFFVSSAKATLNPDNFPHQMVVEVFGVAPNASTFSSTAYAVQVPNLSACLNHQAELQGNKVVALKLPTTESRSITYQRVVNCYPVIGN